MLPPVSQCFRVQGPGSCGESGLHPRSLTLGPSEVLSFHVHLDDAVTLCCVTLLCVVLLRYVTSCHALWPP